MLVAEALEEIHVDDGRAVATMPSTMLFFTSSAYRSMQPPAEVEPAMTRKIEQSLSAQHLV